MDDDGTKDDDKDETEDEKAERQFNEMVAMADRSLNRFNSGPAEVRDATIAEYIETGVLNPETAQVDEIETTMVEAAFALHAEREVFKPLGLTSAQYSTYVDEADMPALRRALVAGDWGTLHRHAQAVAAHIAQHGDSNADLY
ncbi:hypothetical protein [Mesorhizobium wenxiniae]|uniref:Uncharacterized protein n=1 Tax=Mesorhizobium wenxiniae TaxID=2014805 RepID=A0A271KA90_9HYPH|nr:hypothetical protein [Mesorhizobium wenxiniae]PAP92646.1 hypothetical protein CIT31_25305 [Mesorhizobium wenxiniae]